MMLVSPENADYLKGYFGINVNKNMTPAEMRQAVESTVMTEESLQAELKAERLLQGTAPIAEKVEAGSLRQGAYEDIANLSEMNIVTKKLADGEKGYVVGDTIVINEDIADTQKGIQFAIKSVMESGTESGVPDIADNGVPVAEGVSSEQEVDGEEDFGYDYAEWMVQAQSHKISSDAHNIPIKHNPDLMIDILGTDGIIESRRYFDDNERVKINIDFTNHGNPKTHPIVPHAHDWTYEQNRINRSVNGRELSKAEIIANEDVMKNE